MASHINQRKDAMAQGLDILCALAPLRPCVDALPKAKAAKAQFPLITIQFVNEL